MAGSPLARLSADNKPYQSPFVWTYGVGRPGRAVCHTQVRDWPREISCAVHLPDFSRILVEIFPGSVVTIKSDARETQERNQKTWHGMNSFMAPAGDSFDQPELTTDRLLLRPFRLSDAGIVEELLRCKDISDMTLRIPHPYPKGAAKSWIEANDKEWKRGSAVVFAICLNEEPDVVTGACGLEFNKTDENAEIGFWIGKPYWGNGYCTEAAREVVKFGFSRFGLKKIHAGHYVKNPASGRVLENLGMEKEGVRKQHIKKNGKFEDLAVYGIFR